MTFQEHRRIFQQLSNLFQAHLTRKSTLVVFHSIYFSSSSTKNSVSGTSGDYCQKDKIPSTVQPRLAMGHPLRLSLSYQ